MLDAYTVRKAIPRLVIAVIAINLSIYLCVAALDITTIFGKGLNQLLVDPFIDANSFKGIEIEANTENTIVGILGAGAIVGLVGAIIASGGAVAVSILGLLLPFIITVALMSLAILFTLVIWQALVIFLTVISPIAFALYVLPGTEKYFRQWWDLFLRTLIVYPMIAVFFAMSNIMASILLNAAGSSPDGIGVVQLFATVVVVFAPLVLIPFAFKLSGGLISQVGQFAGGQASGLSRRAGQKVRESRQDPNSFLGKGRAKAFDNREKRGLTSGRILSGIGGATHGIATGRGAIKGYRDASGAMATEHSQHRLAEIGKLSSVQPVANNDDYLQALRKFTDDKSRFNYLKEQGYTDVQAQQGVAAIRRAEAVASRGEMKTFAADQLHGTGTGFKEGGFVEANEALLDAAHGDTVLLGNMTAAARSKAQEARRFDLTPGFGTHMRLMTEQYQAQEALKTGKISKADYDAKLVSIQSEATDNALFTQGPGAMVGGRSDSVRQMIPAMRRRVENADAELQAAYDSGDEARFRNAERTLSQVMASTAALHDVASQVSPENGQILADELLGKAYRQGPDGKPVTIMDHIDSLRSNEDFQQMRREYQATTRQQHAQYQTMQAAQRLAGGPNAGNLPGGGVPPAAGGLPT